MKSETENPYIVDSLVHKILNSSKYRNSQFLTETIRDLVICEFREIKDERKLEKSVRRKLHNITAYYLGDPDYSIAEKSISNAIEVGGELAFKAACINIMMEHASTKERIPILDKLYPAIFNYTGRPNVILDLACGLHPLSFPWMNLPSDICYHAFDIHHERIVFLNEYFCLVGLKPLAICRDVLVSFPNDSADVAFIFKEVHRFEQRKRGISFQLIDFLRVSYVVISFPASGMSSGHNLAKSYKNMFFRLIISRKWPVSEVRFDSEIFFIIDKSL